MSNLSLLYAFIGGAIVGAGAAVLFAPEKGEDIRARIADLLRKKVSSALTMRLMLLSNSSPPRLTTDPSTEFSLPLHHGSINA